MKAVKFLMFWLLPLGAFAQSRPVAVPDFATGLEDLPILIDPISNDTDADGDSLSYTLLTQPRNGTITGNLGTFMIYQGNQDYNGADQFLYRVCDNSSRNLCNIGLVIITINPVNDLPTASNDTFTVTEDTPTTLNVISNDRDVDRDTLDVTLFGQPAHATANVINRSKVRYSPNANYNGIDQFRYRVCDGTPIALFCPTASVFIKILPVNDAPVGYEDTIWVTSRDTTYSVKPEQNDFDIEGDILSIRTLGNPVSGAVNFDNSGRLLYTPDRFFFGTFDLPYLVCDASLCDTSKVVIVYKTTSDIKPIPLRIPEGFSPDGDGLNDYWEWSGTEAYEPIDLKVMNRSGVVVYEEKNYKNDWDGQWNGATLPDGTYYYVAHLRNGGGTLKGHLILQR